MATRNPYDRRELSPHRHDYGFVDVGGYPVDILDDGRRAYPGLTFERLNEWCRDEFARGYNVGEGTLERRMEEEILPKARREAWDAGHQAGQVDGQQALLRSIDEQWGEQVQALLGRLRDLAAQEPTPTKTELFEAIHDAQDLLGRLRHAHHNAFVPEIPF